MTNKISHQKTHSHTVIKIHLYSGPPDCVYY